MIGELQLRLRSTIGESGVFSCDMPSFPDNDADNKDMSLLLSTVVVVVVVEFVIAVIVVV